MNTDNIKITATKHTGLDLLRRCAGRTIDAESNLSLGAAYRCEHSMMRTQMFLIDMENIPTFVSVHFVRHGKFTEHFVKSNRIDRGGNGKEDRYTPVNHTMWLNAQALVEMSRKRLCNKASFETRSVMRMIRDAVAEVDPDLAKYMVKNCDYRGGICPELKGCDLRG